MVPTNHIVSIDWLKENCRTKYDCSITQNVVCTHRKRFTLVHVSYYNE
nr:MAG TPA: hypothetical protein [Caudoviricetes sp.]